MLLCPVRDCGQSLSQQDRQWRCPRGHSFDQSRSGYTNLLQPQDRRSRQPGDTVEAVAARRRIHDLGVTQPLLTAIAELTQPVAADTILDAGCGDGFYLANLATPSSAQAYGIDISTPAIDLAARRYKTCHWFVANADRHIPFANQSFSLVLSITARRNSPEFHRVLAPHGRLLVAIPAPDDLIEIRGAGKDRVESTLADFAPHFELVQQTRATTQAPLPAAAVEDLRHSIYRPLQSAPATDATITFSLDLLLFRRV